MCRLLNNSPVHVVSVPKPSQRHLEPCQTAISMQTNRKFAAKDNDCFLVAILTTTAWVRQDPITPCVSGRHHANFAKYNVTENLYPLSARFTLEDDLVLRQSR